MAQPSLFGELVRHFFGRFFDKESLSPQGQPEAGIIQTLGMLATPAGFVCILVLPLGFEGWNLVSLRFLFICYSMIAMGVVMVFEWDALFPDRRDYLLLTPLPLRVFTLFLAKMAALGLFLAMFLGAANLFGLLLWPAVDSKGGWFSITATHLLAMSAAGLFSALGIGALQGILVTVFHSALYRKISVFTQTAVMALLVMFFFLSPLMGSSMEEVCRTGSPVHWFPGFWFAGLYEQLRPAVPHGAHAGAAAQALLGYGTLATRALWLTAGIFLLTFLPGYRRHARRVLEAPDPNPQGPGRMRRRLNAWVEHWLLRDPVECGVFHFIGETIVRSVKHRLFLATYGGFGAALVVFMLASSGPSRRIPLTLSFVLISGLRAAFNFPSDLRANWAFQVSETSSVVAYVRATRKWVTLYAVLPLFALLFGIELASAPWTSAVFQFAFGVTASTLLMEVLFLGFRKVPFTCSHFPGKVNLVLLSVLYVFGFTTYSSYLASLEAWLAATPVAAVLFFALSIGSLAALGRTRDRLLGERPALDYEDDGNPAVCRLGLTE
jgi:hypothetical protein